MRDQPASSWPGDYIRETGPAVTRSTGVRRAGNGLTILPVLQITLLRNVAELAMPDSRPNVLPGTAREGELRDNGATSESMR
jgi:hypothetical protein